MMWPTGMSRYEAKASLVLMEANITSLPIKPSFLIRKMHIQLRTYAEYEQMTGAPPGDGCDNDGFTMSPTFNSIFIFYNEKQPPQRIRWTLAHELAHLYLGHRPPIHAGDPREVSRDPLDCCADLLTAGLLAPPVVLHAMCVQSAQELALCTGLSAEASRYQWLHLQKLRRYGAFSHITLPAPFSPPQPPLDTSWKSAVYHHFLPFITGYCAARTEPVEKAIVDFPHQPYQPKFSFNKPRPSHFSYGPDGEILYDGVHFDANNLPPGVRLNTSAEVNANNLAHNRYLYPDG